MKDVFAHCNECGGDRKHRVLQTEILRWKLEEYDISGSDTYDMLKCLGCEAVRLRQRSWNDEDQEERVQYFPPSMSRQKPAWLEVLKRTLPSKESFVHDLLTEVYGALQNSLPHLAAMGVRSLLERVMIAKVRDNGSFAKNLAEFHSKGFITAVQRRHLETILDAGHATIHRSFSPDEDDVMTIMDIAESIVETVYLHGARVRSLRRRVPKRKKKRLTPAKPTP